MDSKVKDSLDRYVDHLSQLTDCYVWGYDVGNKYIRVWHHFKDSSPTSRSKSVHSFVDKTNGDLYKPASWRAPAKKVRFNLLTDWDTITQVSDPYGSYLYLYRG